MNFNEFQAFRRQLMIAEPTLVDLAETNSYRSIPAAFPGQFGEIEPFGDARAAHRCHLAELLLQSLGLAQDQRSRLLVSHGVRRSLLAFFRFLSSREMNILVPGDVYPKYLELAAMAGTAFSTYSTRSGLPTGDALDRSDAILVCDPLKPWGGELTDEQLRGLVDWGQEHARLVIIDGAYAFPPRTRVLEHAIDGGLVLLGSLSKHWLIPDHLGYCMVPPSLAPQLKVEFERLSKDEPKLRVGFAALTSHGDRPANVQSCLARLRERFEQHMREVGVPIATCAGYFATTHLSFEDLLSRRILGIPPSVFGSTDAGGCVLSTLPHYPPTCSTTSKP